MYEKVREKVHEKVHENCMNKNPRFFQADLAGFKAEKSIPNPCRIHTRGEKVKIQNSCTLSFENPCPDPNVTTPEFIQDPLRAIARASRLFEMGRGRAGGISSAKNSFTRQAGVSRLSRPLSRRTVQGDTNQGAGLHGNFRQFRAISGNFWQNPAN